MTAGEKFRELKSWLMPVGQAAREGLNAFRSRKLTHIPGFFNRVGSVFIKFLPKKFLMDRMSSVYRNSLTKAEENLSSK
jgi:hypothetical protein